MSNTSTAAAAAAASFSSSCAVEEHDPRHAAAPQCLCEGSFFAAGAVIREEPPPPPSHRPTDIAVGGTNVAAAAAAPPSLPFDLGYVWTKLAVCWKLQAHTSRDTSDEDADNDDDEDDVDVDDEASDCWNDMTEPQTATSAFRPASPPPPQREKKPALYTGSFSILDVCDDDDGHRIARERSGIAPSSSTRRLTHRPFSYCASGTRFNNKHTNNTAVTRKPGEFFTMEKQQPRNMMEGSPFDVAAAVAVTSSLKEAKKGVVAPSFSPAVEKGKPSTRCQIKIYESTMELETGLRFVVQCGDQPAVECRGSSILPHVKCLLLSEQDTVAFQVYDFVRAVHLRSDGIVPHLESLLAEATTTTTAASNDNTTTTTTTTLTVRDVAQVLATATTATLSTLLHATADRLLRQAAARRASAASSGQQQLLLLRGQPVRAATVQEHGEQARAAAAELHNRGQRLFWASSTSSSANLVDLRKFLH